MFRRTTFSSEGNNYLIDALNFYFFPARVIALLKRALCSDSELLTRFFIEKPGKVTLSKSWKTFNSLELYGLMFPSL